MLSFTFNFCTAVENQASFIFFIKKFLKTFKTQPHVISWSSLTKPSFCTVALPWRLKSQNSFLPQKASGNLLHYPSHKRINRCNIVLKKGIREKKSGGSRRISLIGSPNFCIKFPPPNCLHKDLRDMTLWRTLLDLKAERSAIVSWHNKF